LKTLLNKPIIIIDDDEDDHYFFRKIFQKLNTLNELIFFNNAHAALEYLKTSDENPFLLLCDINMPLMNGLELRKQINEDQALKLKSIPFIFFSTAASRDQVQQAYDLHVQGFFLKGQSFDEIEVTLKAILEYWRLCKYPHV
jgi:CheY-like chemotaxis protein